MFMFKVSADEMNDIFKEVLPSKKRILMKLVTLYLIKYMNGYLSIQIIINT